MSCIDQIDGEYTDKRRFLIFDYCGNFEYFRQKQNGYEAKETKSLTENIFSKRIRIAMNLQEAAYSDAQYQEWRETLVDTCRKQICTLNPELIEVRLQRQFVEKFQKPDALNASGKGQGRVDLERLLRLFAHRTQMNTQNDLTTLCMG